MLVLSRAKNESIVINDDITVVVIEIRGDRVRLGIEAPKNVPVHRREVFDAIHRNAASQGECKDDPPPQPQGAKLPDPPPSSPPASVMGQTGLPATPPSVAS
jgi:carbon storage regulator